jgi:hypothetical protein
MLGRTMAYALVAAIVLGAVMTFGDWLWAALQIRHTVTAGLLHGAVMCLVLGAAIGLRVRRTIPGVLAGPIIGVLAAGVFYLLAPFLRLMAMFPAWMFFWICFALLQGWLHRDRGVATSLFVGVIAAVLSGLAFYAISGIWTRHDPGGPNYAWNLLAWTFAFLPGFAALFWRSVPTRYA